MVNVFRWLFGGGRNVVTETVEVFRENAEKGAQREADYRNAALVQYAAEFHQRNNRTAIDAFADALNRLIRPAITIAAFYPLYATVRDPETMALVWNAIATLPAGYWAILSLIVPFYFGGRMQAKALDATMFKSAAEAVSKLATPEAVEEVEAQHEDNPALAEWKAAQND